jgi:endonuclease/exonuclease/phosphatase family metal-dependent hydrolase
MTTIKTIDKVRRVFVSYKNCRRGQPAKILCIFLVLTLGWSPSPAFGEANSDQKSSKNKVSSATNNAPSPSKSQTQSTNYEDPTGMGIKIVTWNIKWYPGGNPWATKGDRKRQKKAVQEELETISPTVLLAQEIRDWESFYELCQLSDLTSIGQRGDKYNTGGSKGYLRPLTVSFFPQDDQSEYWPQQVAIASRLRTKAAWSERWATTETNFRPRRGFAVAALYLPDTKYLLLVYSIHLKSNRESEEITTKDIIAMREESAKQLIAHSDYLINTLFKDQVAGVLISGDLNTNADGEFGDRTIEILREGGFYHTWEPTPRQKRLTWIGNKLHDESCLDHVFTKYLGKPQTTLIGNSNPNNPKAGVKDQGPKTKNKRPEGTDLSDHLPLQTIITREDYQVSIYLLEFLKELEKTKTLREAKED